MNAVQEEWEKMRIAYQNRYAKMCKKIKENEFNTDNHGALLEMSYVLIAVFGLTDKQVQEIERNDGFTNADVNNETMISGGKNMSKWSEIRIDFFDTEENKWSVDAWETDDDNEEGSVIAKIDPKTKCVEYLDEDARTDSYAQEEIKEFLEDEIL